MLGVLRLNCTAGDTPIIYSTAHSARAGGTAESGTRLFDVSMILMFVLLQIGCDAAVQCRCSAATLLRLRTAGLKAAASDHCAAKA
jgi:hypothetical protein